MSEYTPGYDQLTGLRDRSVLPVLNRDFAARKRPWSLLILDIDHFKLVNDIYGHLAGDEILSHVAQTIRINLKKSDHALRFGGDEFIIVLPDTTGNFALDLAQRLLFELSNSEFPGGLKISASIGISQSRPTDREVPDLIAMADQALYRAKETGRGRFVLAEDLETVRETEPDFSHMVGRREELQRLRGMLDRASEKSAEFCLLTGYQGTGKTKLADELLNYCHFRQFSVYSAEAHPIAEEENFLMLQIARKVLDDLDETQMLSLKKTVGPVSRETAEQLTEYALRETSTARGRKQSRTEIDLGNILREASMIHPFVVVLENLQWASKPAVAFLAETITRIPKARILYIGMSRDPKILRLLKPIWLTIPSYRIHLPPLGRQDVRTMVFFAVKTTGIPGDVLDYMMDQSGGNALFLRKLIRWCMEMGYLKLGKGDSCLWITPDENQLPGELISVVDLMLGDCSTEELKVLKRAALAGENISLTLLHELTAMDRYKLAEILDRFVELGFIKDDGNYYTFAYGVMRSFLLSRISTSLKKILHKKTAESLKKTMESTGEDLTCAIAHHFCNSNNPDEAKNFAWLAAEKSSREGLHTKSIHWYREYISLASEESDGFLRAHIKTGKLYSIAGKSEIAEEYLKKALSLTAEPINLCTIDYHLGENYQRRSMYSKAMEFYEKCLVRGYSVKPRTGALVNNMVGALLESSFISRIQNRFHHAKAKLKEARDILDAGPFNYNNALEGMYFARLADLESDTGKSEKALEYYQAGLEICIRENDTIGEALILNNMHEIYSINNDYNSMLDTLKQVVKLNNLLDDQLGLAIGYYNLAESYMQLNMLDLSRRYFQMYLELNSKIENRLGMAYGQQGLGKLAMLKGKNAQAAEYFHNASGIFHELECSEMKCKTEIEHVKALIQLEEYDTCKTILEKIDKQCREFKLQNSIIHLRGLYFFKSGRSKSQAITLLEESIKDSPGVASHDLVFMYGNLSAALEDAGRHDDSSTVLNIALQLLGEKLSKIRSDSIRNSIVSRSDVAAFLNTCRSRQLPIPF